MIRHARRRCFPFRLDPARITRSTHIAAGAAAGDFLIKQNKKTIYNIWCQKKNPEK